MRHLIIGLVIFILSFCLGFQAHAENTTSATFGSVEVVDVDNTDDDDTSDEVEVLSVDSMDSSEFIEAASLVVWQ